MVSSILACEAHVNCPNGPCVSCLRNNQCDTFLNYRKEHPEYDEKYARFVTDQSAARKAVEEQLKQRSLLRTRNREQVSLGDPHRTREQNSIVRSSKMKLDFSEVSELENKQVAPGVQELTITKAEEKTSSNGTSMLVVDFKDEEGGFTRDNLCLEGKGAFKMKNFLQSLGIPEEDAEGMAASDFVGLSLTAEVVTEEYEGKTFSKIKKYL